MIARTPQQADSLSFTTDLSLLNCHFESYKLKEGSDDEQIYCTTLPTPGVYPRTLPDDIRLSHAELDARARHNCLAVGMAGEMLYVDAEGYLVGVDVLSVSGSRTYEGLYSSIDSRSRHQSPSFTGYADFQKTPPRPLRTRR